MSTLPANEPQCATPADGRVVDVVIEARPRGVGTITVARLLPAVQRRAVGPFVFVDHMGPVELAPGVGFDVRPHPHIGLSTVTFFYAGENVHRDSLGTVQVNRPGDLNVMTAGRGIVHSERADPAFRATGGRMHGLQIWLALPDAHEDDTPSFEHHPMATLPAITPAAGVRGRVLMGDAFDARSPVRHPSAPVLVDLVLEAGAVLEVPAGLGERALLVIEGALELGPLGGDAIGVNQLAVLCSDAAVRVTASEPTRAMLFAGAPVGPRVVVWNFVASTRERIDRARDAWTAREFPAIPTDDVEFIPWPDEQR